MSLTWKVFTEIYLLDIIECFNHHKTAVCHTTWFGSRSRAKQLWNIFLTFFFCISLVFDTGIYVPDHVYLNSLAISGVSKYLNLIRGN